MERPIGVPEIPEHIEGILKLVPDFRMTPERWRTRDATVFVEARNAGTLGRTAARWRSVYGMDLRGDRVVRGRRYYDRRPLFALLGASLPALPGLDAAEDAADEPLAALPAAGEAQAFVEAAVASRAKRRPWPALARALPGGSASLLQWAGDADLVFAEWQLDGSLGGAPFRMGVVERFDRSGGGAGARAYFDTLALAARLAAPAGA
jgi:hypothetical protein